MEYDGTCFAKPRPPQKNDLKRLFRSESGYFIWDIPRNDANRLQTIARKVAFGHAADWLSSRSEYNFLKGVLKLHQVDSGKVPVGAELQCQAVFKARQFDISLLLI